MVFIVNKLHKSRITGYSPRSPIVTITYWLRNECTSKSIGYPYLYIDDVETGVIGSMDDVPGIQADEKGRWVFQQVLRDPRCRSALPATRLVPRQKQTGNIAPTRVSICFSSSLVGIQLWMLRTERCHFPVSLKSGIKPRL